MNHHIRTTLVAVVLLLIAPITNAADTRQILVRVNGLVCAFCAHGIRRALDKEAAAATVDVDLEAGRVIIGLKPEGDISDERLDQLLTEAGYTVTAIERTVIDGATP